MPLLLSTHDDVGTAQCDAMICPVGADPATSYHAAFNALLRAKPELALEVQRHHAPIEHGDCCKYHDPTSSFILYCANAGRGSPELDDDRLENLYRFMFADAVKSQCLRIGVCPLNPGLDDSWLACNRRLRVLLRAAVQSEIAELSLISTGGLPSMGELQTMMGEERSSLSGQRSVPPKQPLSDHGAEEGRPVDDRTFPSVAQGSNSAGPIEGIGPTYNPPTLRRSDDVTKVTCDAILLPCGADPDSNQPRALQALVKADSDFAQAMRNQRAGKNRSLLYAGEFCRYVAARTGRVYYCTFACRYGPEISDEALKGVYLRLFADCLSQGCKRIAVCPFIPGSGEGEPFIVGKCRAMLEAAVLSGLPELTVVSRGDLVSTLDLNSQLRSVINTLMTSSASSTASLTATASNSTPRPAPSPSEQPPSTPPAVSSSADIRSHRVALRKYNDVTTATFDAIILPCGPEPGKFPPRALEALMSSDKDFAGAVRDHPVATGPLRVGEFRRYIVQKSRKHYYCVYACRGSPELPDQTLRRIYEIIFSDSVNCGCRRIAVCPLIPGSSDADAVIVGKCRMMLEAAVVSRVPELTVVARGDFVATLDVDRMLKDAISRVAASATAPASPLGSSGNPTVPPNSSKPPTQSEEGFVVMGHPSSIFNATQVPQAKSRMRQRYCDPTDMAFRLEVAQGDLTYEDTDAIVNAANENLNHGSGIAAAIVDRGGQSIVRESRDAMAARKHKPLGPTEAVVTGAGAMPSIHVIHVVGPRLSYGTPPTQRTSLELGQAVTAALEAATTLNCRSITIPCISSGIFGVPVPVCAKAIVQAVRDYRTKTRGASTLVEVRFVSTDANSCNAFCDELEKTAKCVPDDGTPTAQRSQFSLGHQPAFTPTGDALKGSSVEEQRVGGSEEKRPDGLGLHPQKPIHQQPASTGLDPRADTLSVVTLNLLDQMYYDRFAEKSSTHPALPWKQRKHIIRQYFNEAAPTVDVFLVQEYFAGDFGDLFATFPAKGPLADFDSILGDGRNETSAILYNRNKLRPVGKPIRQQFPPQKDKNGKEKPTTKCFVAQRLAIVLNPQVQITFVSTHVPFGGSPEELDSILSLFRDHSVFTAKASEPLIVGGDFNVDVTRRNGEPLLRAFPTSRWADGLQPLSATSRSPSMEAYSKLDYLWFTVPPLTRDEGVNQLCLIPLSAESTPPQDRLSDLLPHKAVPRSSTPFFSDHAAGKVVFKISLV